MTPSCTSGAISLTLTGKDHDHAFARPLTFLWSSSVRGLYLVFSYVRRHRSQSLLGGLSSIDSLTGVSESRSIFRSAITRRAVSSSNTLASAPLGANWGGFIHFW